MKIQVTYFCTNGKYKPVASIIEVPSARHFQQNREYWLSRARALIRAKRYWSETDMEKYGYTEWKARAVK